MTEDRMEEIAEKYRFKFMHQVITIVGLPLVVFMGGLIGSMILSQVAEMKADLKIAIGGQATNRENIAVNTQKFRDYDRRIVSLETWREGSTARQ